MKKAILILAVAFFSFIVSTSGQTLTFSIPAPDWAGSPGFYYYDFGNVNVGDTSSETYFQVSGSGFVPPAGPPLIVEPTTADFLISLTSGGPYSSQISITTITGGNLPNTDIYVVFAPTSGSSSGDYKDAYMRFSRSGTIINDNEIYVYGYGYPAASPPEMDVTGNGQPIANGSTLPSLVNHTDFGSISASSTFQRTYTINNSGGSDLVLADNNPPAGEYVLIGGANPGKFSVTSQPASGTIAASGSETFDVTFDPDGAAGYFTATVSIGNNDSDENPYTYVIAGTATADPPTVSEPADAYNITANSGTSNASVTSNGGATVTERGMCYKLFGDPGDPTISDFVATSGSGTGYYVATMSGLDPQTHYKFRSYATNSAGTGYSSATDAPKDFWTLSNMPASQPANFTATAYSTTQINLVFTAASSITYADGYIILMRQGQYPDVSLVSNGTAYTEGEELGSGSGTFVEKIISSTSATTSQVTGLSATTEYYFTIIPYNWNSSNSETYHYNTTSPKSDFATTSAATSTWDGTGSWFTDANWSNGIPGFDTDAIIQQSDDTDPLVVDANAQCNDLTIKEGAYVTVNTGRTLTVNGDFKLESTSAFTGTGSLLVNGTFSVAGTTSIERYLQGGRRHYVSSPTTSTTGSKLARSNNSDNDFFGWDEPQSLWIDLNQATPSTLTPGVGYEVMYNLSSSNPETLDFDGGTINNSNISPTVTYSTATANPDWVGWNLVGNPFPCAIDWDVSGWTKNNITGSIYIWDNSQYISWNGTTGAIANGIIAPMQGFFIRGDGLGSPTLTIPRAARLHSPQQFYKNELLNHLVLKVEGNGYKDQTYFHFNDYATMGFDNMYDAYKLPGLEEAPQLYSVVGNEILSRNDLMSINVMPRVENTTVLVGFEVGAEGIYTITAEDVETFSESLNISLEDLRDNIIIDLKETKEYSFTATPGDERERFLLHFDGPFSVDELEKNADIRIWSYSENIYVDNTNEDNGEVIIYNLMGQEILREGLESGLNTINMSSRSGYYVVRVITETSTKAEKVYVQ